MTIGRGFLFAFDLNNAAAEHADEPLRIVSIRVAPFIDHVERAHGSDLVGRGSCENLAETASGFSDRTVDYKLN